MEPLFYFPSGASDYSFGSTHPLRPERLAMLRSTLGEVAPDLDLLEPEPVGPGEAHTVHSREYVEAVARLSSGFEADRARFGFASADNPVFRGMYEAALAYLAGSWAAAQSVREGQGLAFNWTGGLHHAMRSRAAGFCIFNDAAVACSLLREAHNRVMYVDIDLHHGDGVQALFWDDPRVLTFSIHESGATLFPGSGFVDEVGPAGTSVNVPLAAGTSGDVWLHAFLECFVPVLERYCPGAIVLQAGCDAHRDDPLGHLECSVQDWLGAVEAVGSTGLPLVVLGGGGYELANVHRMWAAATLRLLGRDAARFHDEQPGFSRGHGREHAEATVAAFLHDVLPGVPSIG
ncbi:MAG: acetoin utilization protein AcuC [Fimbriimonadaceae bacterium]|nr:acetoin utilization protein AcuC [Fimbriimonadaceae bacterium]